MKKQMLISLDKDMYHKIHIINTIKKYFFDDKTATISSMAEQAFNEYFKSHEKEINELMKKYDEMGGCFKI